MDKNYDKKLEIQEEEIAEREIQGKNMWESDFISSYERLREKLNPDEQHNMKIFTVFWELDCQCKVTMEQLFQQLEKWGYAKYIETEDGAGTVICKKPYTDIFLIPRIDIDGYMEIDREFVISKEVAKKLKEYSEQQDKKNKLF